MRPLIAIGAVGAFLLALVQAEEAGLGFLPEERVLLLRNGHTIKGQITRAGDVYHVALPNGEIRVKAGEVELCCRDLEEGYRRKRGAIQPGNVHDHLQLAEWCQRQGLVGYAARELAEAMDADPRHPMIAILQRRLKAANDPPPEPAEPAKIDESAKVLSAEQLQQLVRGMPPRAVEHFTQSIQPLLINHCASATCHGQAAQNEFRLLQVPVNKPASRLITQRNLHATVQWIDRRSPAESRLLTAIGQPHGTAKSAIFAEHQQAQYQRLAHWVGQMAERPTPQAPATVEGREPALLQSAAPGPRFQGFPQTRAEAGAQRASVDEPVGGGVGSPARNGSVKRGAPLPPSAPADPFDPEIFNRRFFGGETGLRP